MKSRKFDMAALRTAFADNKSDNKSATDNKWLRFYDMEFDESMTLRIVQDVDVEGTNVTGMVRKSSTHRFKIGDTFKTFTCNRHNHNEDCALCDASAALYKEKRNDEGRKIYKSDKFFMQCLVVESPTGETDGMLKFVSFTKNIFEQIKDGLTELDEAPFDIENGTDLKIKKTKNGEWAKYTVSFVRKERALTETEIATIEADAVDLATLLPAAADATEVEQAASDYLESIS